MAWKYDSASFRGTKTNPKAGDSVSVRVIEDSDADNILEQIFTWGYDPNDGLSLVQFRNQVKREMKFHLQALNRKRNKSDVTGDFDPA